MTAPDGSTPERATIRRQRTGRKVPARKRSNPGRALYRALTKKADAATVEGLLDVELLRVIVGEQAAQSLVEATAPHGGVAGLYRLGDVRDLTKYPGVDEATAARVAVVWELAARIARPHIEAAARRPTGQKGEATGAP